MSGVTWGQRQPTDWLASNGRWYEASAYPRGWSTTALPPAPGHGGVGSILRRYAETATTPKAEPGAPTNRRVADATLTETYETNKAPAIPAPPGRLRPELPEPARPAPPAAAISTIPPPSPPAGPPSSGSFEVVAGDLGKVLGTAKKRIEKAIDDASTS